MVNKTRNSPSRSVVVGPGHKEQSADNDLLGKVFVRRESGRRLNLALMERSGSAKFSDCSSDCSEGVQPRSAAAGLLGEHIGKELRGLYAEVVAQPVPDRFLELLNKLEAGTIYLEDGAPNPEGSD